MAAHHMKRLHGHSVRLRTGTVCGRMGLLADGSRAPQVLLDNQGISGELPRKEDAAERPGSADAMGNLNENQKAHVMAVLGKTGACGAADVGEFKAMHPGIRELRMRNRISAVWTDGEWKPRLQSLMDSGVRLPEGYERADLIALELASVRGQLGNLCFALGLADASPKERREALLFGGGTTAFQRSFFPGGDEDSLKALESALDKGGTGCARHFWRSGKPNAISAASAIHKLRFTRGPLTDDEESFLKAALDSDSLSMADLNWLVNAAASDITVFGPLIDSVRFAIGNPSEPLLEAARAHSEFDTVLHLLGRRAESVICSVIKNPGFTKARKTATNEANGDAYTSLSLSVISRGDERRISLDAVFDGVSGQGGASIASRKAKDALEISALAGWIRGPEDVRLAAILADLLIDLDKKDLGHSDMGTTMAVAYVEGDSLFGIHCGDSDWKVIRNGEVLAKSSPHGMGNRIWSGLGIGPRDLHINNLGGMGYGPIRLKGGDMVLVQTDGTGDIVCDHEICILAANDPPDAARTRDSIVSLAEGRGGTGPYDTLCGCEPLEGKNDDKAIIVRLIRHAQRKSGPRS